MAYTMDDIKRMRQEYAASGKMASQMDMKPVENPKYSMEDIQKMRVAITGESAPRQQISSFADTQKSKRSGTSSKKRSAASSANSSNPADHSNVKVTYKKKGNLEVGGTYNGYAVQAMGKKRGIKYSDLHPENSARIPSIEDYQKQDDARSKITDTSQKTTENQDLEKKDSKLPVLVTPQAKSNVTQKTNVKRASSYLEGGSSTSGFPYAAEQQNAVVKNSAAAARQDTLMPQNATEEDVKNIVSKWSDPSYKLSSAEKKAAQEYIDNYYKTANGFSGQSSLNPITRIKAGIENAKIRENWTPKEQAQYETVVSLENKLSKGAAFMSSFADATGTVDSAEQIGENVAKSFTGNETEIPSLENLAQGTKNQNPGSAFAGTMAGQAAKYAFTKQLLGQIPGYDGLNQKLSEQFGKIPILGQFGDNLANIAADTTVDLAADTLPQIAQNVQSGMSASEVAKEAGKNIAGNVAWNAVGEGVGEGLKRLPTLSDLVRKGQNVAKQELPMLGNMGELSAADIADLTEQAAKSANDVANVAKQGAESVTAASRSVSDILSSDATNKEIDNIISDPTLRTEFKQITGKQLTGSKADMRNAVKQGIADGTKKVTDPVEKALLDPDVAKTHTPEQIKQMQEYLGATDQRIINYANEVRSAGKNGYVKPLQVSTVSDRAANDIKNLTGIDTVGNRVVIDKSTINHIDSRHGIKGNADHSMADDETLARMVYILNNYDSVELGNSTKGTRLANGEYAPTVVFSKKVDGTYYTVEAVTDAKTKTNRIVSAYASKKEAYPVSYADSLPRTSTPKPEFTSSNNSIPNSAENVNKASKTLAMDVEDGASISSGIIGDDGKAYGKAYESRTGASLMAEDGKKLSQLRTNTFERAPEISDDMLKQIDENVDFSYDPLSTKEANARANDRLAKELAGEVKRLSTEQFKDSTDVKEAMNLLTGRVDNQSLSNDDFNALARNLARNSREYGRGLQSLQEYAGTADDALIKASSILNKKTDEMLKDNPKLGQEIENVAEELVNKVREISGIKEAAEAAGELPWYDEATDIQKAVQDIINMSSFKNKVDDSAVDRIVSMLENQKDTTEIVENLDTLVANGIFGISDETLEAVDNLFAEAEKYGEFSKQRADILSQAYAKLASEVSTSSLMDKWDAWRYMAMLGNTRTHIRNIVGNQMFGAVTGIKNNVAAVMESAVDKVGKATGSGGIERTKSILNPLIQTDSALIKAGKQDAIDGVYSLLSDGNKYNVYSAIESEKRVFKNGILEKLRKFNNDALDAEDFFALRSKYSTSLAGYLKANGADASIFNATDDASKRLLNNARSYAIREAQEATFHEANAAAQAISNLSQNLKGSGTVAGKLGYAVLEGAVPFKKTPLNIVREGVRYSPVSLVTGTVDAADSIRKGNKTAAEAIDKLAKGLTGSGVMALGAWLGSQGILKGAGDSDSDVNYYESGIGSQNYSIQIGDHNYTLDWAAPTALPLFVGVELQNSFAEQGLSTESLFNALSNISEPILETTMLSGLNDILDSVSNSDDTPGGAIANVAFTAGTNYATQAIPTLAGQIARSVDDTRRDTYSEKTGTAGRIDKQLEKLQNKIPVLSQQNEAYINHWGQEEKNPGGNVLGRLAYNMLSPGYYANTSEMTDVDRELIRLYGTTGSADIAPSSYVTSVSIGGSNVRLSEKQHEQVARNMGSLQYSLLSDFMKTDVYQNMSDYEKAERIPDIYSLAKEVAAANNVDGYEGKSKLYKVYDVQGEQGAIDYLVEQAETSQMFDAAGIEQTGYAGKSRTDKAAVITASDMSAEEQGSFYMQTVTNDKKAAAVQKALGNEGVATYLEMTQAVADEKGNYNILDTLKWLDKQSMQPEEKGVYLYATGSSGETREKFYSRFGYEGIYDYYKIKSEADADGNGSLKQDELIPYLENRQYDEETKRLYFALFYPNSKKNPF